MCWNKKKQNMLILSYSHFCFFKLKLHSLFIFWPLGGSTISCKHNIYMSSHYKVDMAKHPADTEHQYYYYF